MTERKCEHDKGDKFVHWVGDTRHHAIKNEVVMCPYCPEQPSACKHPNMKKGDCPDCEYFEPKRKLKLEERITRIEKWIDFWESVETPWRKL